MDDSALSKMARSAEHFDDVAFAALLAAQHRVDADAVAKVLAGAADTSTLPAVAANELLRACALRAAARGECFDVRTALGADGRREVLDAIAAFTGEVTISDRADALEHIIAQSTSSRISALTADDAASVLLELLEATDEEERFSDRVEWVQSAIVWLTHERMGTNESHQGGLPAFNVEAAARVAAFASSPVLAGAAAYLVAPVAAALLHRRPQFEGPQFPLPAPLDVAVSELAAEMVSGDAPEIDDLSFDVWPAVVAHLYVVTGDPDAAVAPFGVSSAAELDDELFDACLTHWSSAKPQVPLDAFLVAATEAGTRRRPATSAVLRHTSPSLPVEVAAALVGGQESLVAGLADEFLCAATGDFGHGWATDDVLAVVAGNEILADGALKSSAWFCNNGTPHPVAAALAEQSMVVQGLGIWAQRAPGFLAAQLAEAAAAVEPLGTNGWAVIWKLLEEFHGTPAELVDVAALTAPRG